MRPTLVPRGALLGAGLTMLAVMGAAAQAARAADAAVPESLSVAECVALARRGAPEVRAQAGDYRAAARDSAATALNRRPAWSVFGGALVAPSWSYDPALTNLGEYGMRLGMELPLTDGGTRRRDRQRAALSTAGAAVELARSSRDAGTRAAAVALGALRQREQDEARRETLAWLDRLIPLVQLEVRTGSRPRSDAVRLSLERDAVLADLETLGQEREALRRELAELIQRAPDAPLNVAAATPEDDRPPADADSAALLARVEPSPEVASARLAESDARLALDQARQKNALRVDLTLDAGLWGSDLTATVPNDLKLENPNATFSDRLRRDLGASAGLQFHRAVLDPAAGRSVTAREAALDAATQRAEAASARRRRELLDLFGRWRAAARRLALAEGSRTRAEENLLRLRSMYTGGGSTLLELLDALDQLGEARTRLADARLETRLARWESALQ